MAKIISAHLIVLFVVFLSLITPVHAQNQLLYNFDKPSSTYEMPNILEEISGIYLMDDDRFACIQDELGIIFIYDTSKREVVEEILFDKDKDYEDIEIIGDDAYVLEADGDIRRVRNFLSDEVSVVSYETVLRSDNDTEGLTYDPVHEALLVACKGDPSLKDGPEYKNKRAVYRLSLKTKKMEKTPFLLIDLDKLMQIEDMNALARLSYRLAAALDPNGDVRFQPSAIAIHPETDNIYILSFTSTMLTVFDRSGILKNVIALDKKIFQQPEGMCFDKNGNLFISNEANGGTANILKFEKIEVN